MAFENVKTQSSQFFVFRVVFISALSQLPIRSRQGQFITSMIDIAEDPSCSVTTIYSLTSSIAKEVKLLLWTQEFKGDVSRNLAKFSHYDLATKFSKHKNNRLKR